MMEARLESLFKKPEEYTVLERFLILFLMFLFEHVIVT